MPPIPNQNRTNSQEQEGRILLAISDLKNERLPSIRCAARTYNVPYTTLSRRLNGISFGAEKHVNGHKLTQFEEESLIKWILDYNKRGFPPRPALVREMANYLFS
jgi:hypothetical protein